MSSVSCVLIAKDCTTLDYSLYPAITTALKLQSLNKFYINVGYSNDDTYSFVKSFDDPRIEVIHKPWHMNKSFWADERNLLIEKAKLISSYLLILDADEFLFDDAVQEIDSFVQNPGPFLGMKLNYRHFVRIATGDSQDCLRINRSNHWYQSHTKLVSFKLNPHLSMVGDNADDFVGIENGHTVYLHFHAKMKRGVGHVGHLGYARCAKAAGLKFTRADSIYQHQAEYEDGHIPEYRDFSYGTYIASPYLTKVDFELPESVVDWIQAKSRLVSYERSTNG